MRPRRRGRPMGWLLLALSGGLRQVWSPIHREPALGQLANLTVIHLVRNWINRTGLTLLWYPFFVLHLHLIHM
ncbi:hypothetical protein BRADI_2g61875v3 [Brachypodium distachyon]|uniref:Uncharacterized protein n=1 Tax=Brachypodium distachyon TaxID=15368 RepID=A0A2K2DH99_BRADI|nr:hypothetical protein BRADI_2g61875v3 [Brachypodium distachyon]